MSALKQAIRRAATDQARQENGTWVQRFHFPQHFVGFAGHFPDMPVLPAIAQLLAAACVMEAALGRGLRVASVSKAKFLAPIRPETDVRVEAAPRESDPLTCAARLYTGGELAASFTLGLAEDGS